jgi:hypothetical protein
MTCVKTGCHIYLSEYNAYAYGDAHQFGNVFVFRLVGGPSHSPLDETLHYTVHNSLEWFERNRTDGSSTLIAGGVSFHGYEGKPLNA